MILASLCNNGFDPRGSLLLIKEDLSSWRYVPHPKGVPKWGITGLSLSERYLALATQDGAVAILDRNNLSLKSRMSGNYLKNAHSILIDKDRLYAVSTGSDAVVAFDLVDGVLKNPRVVWKVSDASFGADNHHLNSICSYEGCILVSGFGKKESKLWSSAKEGFVIDIGTNTKVAEGLCQPHSLSVLEGSLFICESAKARILNVSKGQDKALDGYVRGLCLGPLGIYVAVSRGRTVSKSTGLQLSNPADPGALKGQAKVYLLDKDTLQEKATSSFGGLEFFDLVRLGDEVNGWPL
jgi:uncharacterized protein DUF4915